MDQTLLVFVTVAERANFSRAAEDLHMTQPAVSQYIQSLERSVGTRLLDRNNKYVRLNQAGEIVYHYAKKILAHYTQMQHLVDDLMEKASGPIAIGASYTFGEYALPHVVARMCEVYPLIKPSIVIGNTKEIAEEVISGQIDVGIVEGDFHHEKLAIEPFAEDVMEIIVGRHHRLANQPAVKVVDLKNETWIVREKGSGTREATEKMFEEWHLCPENLMTFGSTQIIKESAEAGLGVSLLSNGTIRKELALGTLRTLKIKGHDPITRKFSIVIRATPFQTKAQEVLISLLKSKEVLSKWETPLKK